MRGEEHIGWLEIAMDDPAGVQRRERRKHAEADRQCFGHAHRPAPQSLGERLALQQLHGDEQVAAVFADLVDLTDIGMIHTGRGAGFTPESLARRLIIAERRHRLQRDGTRQAFIARCVHHAHAAFTQFSSDGIVPDAGREVLSGEIARATGRRLWRRRHACQPVVEAAQPSFGCVVSRLVRHKNLSVTKSRSYLQPCGCYLKMFPSALLIAFVASSLSLFFMARVAAAPTSMRTAGD